LADERWSTVRSSSDGKRLFAVYDNGRAVHWELDSAVWRRHACAVAGGGLGRARWVDTVPEHEYRATC
jgi:hypothetical protein